MLHIVRHTSNSMPMQAIRQTVTRPDDRAPLLDFLARRLRLSRKAAKRLLDARSVFVNDRRVWMARHELRTGDLVEVHARAEPAPRTRLPVLFEDEHVIVISKPAGILSNGPGSAEALMRAQTGIAGLEAVHRLDRDTSGCLILARTPETRRALVELFAAHRVRKTYHAIVTGRVPREEQEIRAPVDGQAALTRVRRLSCGEEASHVSLSVETGRTHQVRKHMAAIRHPVLGDRMYATGAVASPALRAVARQMLHATEVSFPHPVAGTPVVARSPLPPDFRACLRALKLD